MLSNNSFKTITICTSDSSLVSVSKTVFFFKEINPVSFPVATLLVVKTYDNVGAFWIREDIKHIARDFESDIPEKLL